MYCPVGSKRAAKISPEWPVNSITGDCSALVREPYSTCQHVAIFSLVLYQKSVGITYRLYQRAICARAIHDGYCRASQIRVRLGALDQLARAKSLVGGSLFSRHGDGGVLDSVYVWGLWIGARWLWSVVAGKLSSRQIYARARASQVRSSAVRMLPDETTRLDISDLTYQTHATVYSHTSTPHKSSDKTPQSWRHRPKQPAWARSELQTSSSCCTCANRCQSVEVSLAYGHSKRPLLTVPGLE